MGQRSSRIPAAGTLNDPLLLAIDLGSQSVRARLYDRQGQSHARADVALCEPQSRHNGWAEHEPGYLQSAVADACCEALSAADLRQRVAGVGLTTVRASVVLVDRKGTPLRPIIMWSDKRRLRQPPQPRGIARLAHYLPLLGPTLRQVQGEAECNWVARHEAKTWANTHKMLLLSGYLNHWLTGNFLDAAAAQVGYVPFDPRRGDWAGERNWRWQLLPVLNRGMLPDLRPVSTALGRVCERAAAATRIPPGTPVIASAGDKACEVLGSAPARKATAYLSLGTAAATNLYTDTYRQPHWLMPAFPAAIPGHWLLERQIDRGMSVVGSFAQQIGASLPDIDARDRAQLDQLLQRSPPGANGLGVNPFVQPGTDIYRSLDGYSDSRHTPADIYRALLEGLCFALRHGTQRLQQRRGRTAVDRVCIAGGGARSHDVVNLVADIFALPAGRTQQREAATLGVAIDTAVGVGLYPDHPAAIAAMCKVPDYSPVRAAEARIYQPLFEQFVKQYGAMADAAAIPGQDHS